MEIFNARNISKVPFRVKGRVNGLVEIMEFARGNNFGKLGSNICDACSVSK